MTVRTCAGCGKSLDASRRRAKYCSSECREEVHLPTPDEIRESADAIRESWSEADRASRAVGRAPTHDFL